jgi:hypothetical protein
MWRGDIFLTEKCLCKERLRLLKIFTFIVEKKYFFENLAPLLNANFENSVGFLRKNAFLKITLLCVRCNWCIYNKIGDKHVWRCVTGCPECKTTRLI